MKSKLSILDKIILVSSALVGDLLNTIPLVNVLVGVISTCFFQTYFFLKGVKKAHYSLAGNLLELIPGLSIFPMLTAGVLGTIIMNGRHEKVVNKKLREAKAQQDKQISKQIAARNAHIAAVARRQQQMINSSQ